MTGTEWFDETIWVTLGARFLSSAGPLPRNSPAPMAVVRFAKIGKISVLRRIIELHTVVAAGHCRHAQFGVPAEMQPTARKKRVVVYAGRELSTCWC
jgi:hypothetical protein